jgi:Spy/CpxP family protein refolding chaperone
MRKIKVNNWVAGIVVLLLLTGFQANAQWGRGHGHEFGTQRGYGQGLDSHIGMETILDLSEEQLNKIEKIQLEFQKISLPILNKVSEKNAQLNSMITEGADQSKINQQIDEIGDLQATIRKERVYTHLKVRELLTEGQKIKFDTHFRNRFYRNPNRFHHNYLHGKGLK